MEDRAMCPHDKGAKVLLTMFGSMPWVARSAPEALYLPRDFLRAAAKSWTPEDMPARDRPS
jgi:hypothetical protein